MKIISIKSYDKYTEEKLQNEVLEKEKESKKIQKAIEAFLEKPSLHKYYINTKYFIFFKEEEPLLRREGVFYTYRVILFDKYAISYNKLFGFKLKLTKFWR